MTQKAIQILKKKYKPGYIMCPDFKLYYKAIVNKRMWCCHKRDTQINEENSTDINPYVYIYLINLWQRSKNIHMVYSINYVGNSGQPQAK